jgi:predicted phage terminase large subunit-like protein
VKLCQKYEPDGVYIDDDNASKVWAKLVFEVAKNEGVAVPMQILPISRRDKETRAAPLRSYFLQDRISILQAPWNTDLLFEISKFPVGCRHDDQIDAMALVAAQLMKLNAPKVAEQQINQHETVIGMVDGKMVLNESIDALFQQCNNNQKRFSKVRI